MGEILAMTLLHAGLLDIASKSGSDIALTDATNSMTYSELIGRACRMARLFESAAGEANVRPIALCGAKSVDAIVAICAALITGRGYAFLNPKQRATRLASMVEDLRPSLIVDLGSSEWDHNPRALAHDAPVIQLPTVLPEHPIEPVQRPHGCAYAFFTSGSTGRPKGVVVSHAAAWRAQQAFIQDVGLTAGDVVCSEMGLGFDVSTIDIFASLAAGATLDVTPEATVDEPRAFFRKLVERRVTRLFTCPTAARLVLQVDTDAVSQLSELKLSLTGELISAQLAELMRPLIAKGNVWNQYGATEFPFGLSRRLAVDDITKPNVVNNPTIGSPVQVRLSDVGDITLVGPGLFSGYVAPDTDFSRPLHSVNSFVTGDQAEPAAPGTLRLVGRSDNQCRKDGHRIELREIECAAERHAGVDLCYATYEAASNAIVVRVTARDGLLRQIDLIELRKYMERELPDYMLPDRIEQLAAPPRTLSGKKRYKGEGEVPIIQ